MTMISTDVTDQMNEDLKLLVAAGIYKSKSEALRDAIRTISDKYRDRIESVKELRKMDEKKNTKKASDVLDEMRSEEMH